MLPVFGVRCSVTFHLTCVHIILAPFRLMSGHLLGNMLKRKGLVSTNIMCNNVVTNKNIIMSSFKSSRDIQKKESGSDSCFG